MANQDIKRRVAAAAAFAVALSLAGPASAGFKCWRNADGVRECGNSVPPEYAQQGHKQMSSQGVTVSETTRAKTREELDAERLATETAERERQEAERLARVRAAHDRVLLGTFTSEKDLLLARDGKLEAIDSRIRHQGQVVARLEETLVDMQGEAARLERAGRKIPEDLLESISSLESRIDANRSLIERRHAEKQEVAARFDADLVRYRELKGR